MSIETEQRKVPPSQLKSSAGTGDIYSQYSKQGFQNLANHYGGLGKKTSNLGRKRQQLLLKADPSLVTNEQGNIIEDENYQNKEQLALTGTANQVIGQGKNIGGNIYQGLQETFGSSFSMLKNKISDLIDPNKKTDKKGLLLLAGSVGSFLFMANSLIQGIKGFSGNSKISGISNVAKAILAGSILQGLSKASKQGSFAQNGSSSLKSMSGKAMIILLLTLTEQCKYGQGGLQAKMPQAVRWGLPKVLNKFENVGKIAKGALTGGVYDTPDLR